MTKEEKIKEAWGVDYHDKIRDNGWSVKKPEDSNICLFDVKTEGCTDILPFDSSRSIYRPKSIKGIENNNGWLEIENEDDLPYCDFEDLWVFINDKVKLYSEVVRLRNLESGYFETDITYYQPIFKPKPPIY